MHSSHICRLLLRSQQPGAPHNVGFAEFYVNLSRMWFTFFFRYSTSLEGYFVMETKNSVTFSESRLNSAASGQDQWHSLIKPGATVRPNWYKKNSSWFCHRQRSLCVFWKLGIMSNLSLSPGNSAVLPISRCACIVWIWIRVADQHHLGLQSCHSFAFSIQRGKQHKYLYENGFHRWKNRWTPHRSMTWRLWERALGQRQSSI